MILLNNKLTFGDDICCFRCVTHLYRLQFFYIYTLIQLFSQAELMAQCLTTTLRKSSAVADIAMQCITWKNQTNSVNFLVKFAVNFGFQPNFTPNLTLNINIFGMILFEVNQCCTAWVLIRWDVSVLRKNWDRRTHLRSWIT